MSVGMFAYDAMPRLRKLGVPCAYVRADVPTDLAGLPSSILATRVDGTGHWVHIQAPEQVNAAIEQLLADVESRRTREVRHD
jgi:pimeloyl-ACP methyl ester carboxylesterase